MWIYKIGGGGNSAIHKVPKGSSMLAKKIILYRQGIVNSWWKCSPFKFSSLCFPFSTPTTTTLFFAQGLVPQASCQFVTWWRSESHGASLCGASHQPTNWCARSVLYQLSCILRSPHHHQNASLSEAWSHCLAMAGLQLACRGLQNVPPHPAVTHLITEWSAWPREFKAQLRPQA